MGQMDVHKTTIGVLICPNCGQEHQSIYGTREGYSCDKCNYFFGKEINDNMWTERKVEAINCDICGMELICTSENFSMSDRDFKEILCSKCNDSGVDNYLLMHSVAIKYRGKWVPTSKFLNKKDIDSFLPVKSLRDAITLHVLNRRAKIDESSFRSVSPEDSKILWKDGEAIGYHTVNKYRGKSCLRQIYVRPGYRRQGHATAMVKEFRSKNKGEIYIESPNQASLKLLKKMGLISIDEKGELKTDGITFITEGRT